MSITDYQNNNVSRAFPDGGIYLMRSDELYLMCVCHRIGVNGAGPHKHNDWLSFELCVGEHPVIIDPGTCCYTGNMEMRRLFRSTAYHNTVVVDGEEQIPIHNSMFGLVNPSGDINVMDWQSNDSFDSLQAEHTGYERLPNPVAHRRHFHLDKKRRKITLEDRFLGQGKHDVQFYFHLDKDIICEVDGNKAIFYKSEIPVLKMETIPDHIELEINEGWVSKAYNHKEPAQVLSWKTEIDADVPMTMTHLFSAHYQK